MRKKVASKTVLLGGGEYRSASRFSELAGAGPICNPCDASLIQDISTDATRIVESHRFETAIYCASALRGRDFDGWPSARCLSNHRRSNPMKAITYEGVHDVAVSREFGSVISSWENVR
jgi:hypothetical protein